MTGDKPIAVVTGAARRVGAATCRRLARAGCDIVLTYRSSEEEAHQRVRDLRAMGVEAEAHALDLSDLDAVQRVGDDLARSLPRCDVLVHNASIYEPTPLEEFTAADAERHFRVNALGPALLTKSLRGLLTASKLPGGGAVVTMCDMHVLGRPRKGFLAYSMSKAALTEMVRTLAREMAPRVRVNGVAPGVVEWPEAGYESDQEAQEAYIRRVPLQRAGEPEDAAEAVRWLALEATYVTGEIIRIDGGRWLA